MQMCLMSKTAVSDPVHVTSSQKSQLRIQLPVVLNIQNYFSCAWKINWATISVHPTGSTFCLLFFFFHFSFHDLRGFWFVCADAWGEGGEWKVCYVKNGMFIIPCLVGTSLGGAVCLLFWSSTGEELSLALLETYLKQHLHVYVEEPTCQSHWAQTMGFLKAPAKLSVLHLNLVCHSQVEKHWKRSVLPNQEGFSSSSLLSVVEWHHHPIT